MTYVLVKARSGLHAGATWSCGKSFVSMGANPNSEVFICDNDAPDTLMTLRRFGRRYQIETLHPEVKLSGAECKPGESSLFSGQELTIDFRHVQLYVSIQHGKQGWVGPVGDFYQRIWYAILNGLRNIGAKAIVAMLFLISLLITSYILFFGSVGTVQAKAVKTHEQRLAAGEVPEVKKLEVSEQIRQSVLNDLSSFLENENIRTVDIQSVKDQLTLEGNVSRKQLYALEKKLIRLATDFGDHFNIKAKFELSKEQSLVDGIQVHQLIIGSRSVAILDNGEKIYEGGNYEGLKVMRIDTEKLVLEGDTRYEVSI